jgi:threo-3-hydroxy-L-aspartate ammonia-lyase
MMLGAAEIAAAADRISGQVRRTPLLRLPALPGLLVKAEHLQRTGSFKARGAANAILGLHAADVVTGSSGNHGIAVASLGAALGLDVTVVMAEGANPDKAAALNRLGARLIPVAGGVAERERHAQQSAARTGAVLVPSSDHPLVVAGAATVGLEILQDDPEVKAIFVPAGGGGLLAGVCLAAESLSSPVRIIGVEPASCPRYARSLAAGQPVELPPSDTIADGLRGQRPGNVPFPIIRRRVDELTTVTDDQIRGAVDLLQRTGIDAEPSGAVAIAAVLQHRLQHQAVAVVSGGNTARRCGLIRRGSEATAASRVDVTQA